MFRTDDSRIEALANEIRTLTTRVGELKGERDSVSSELSLSKRITALEKEKTEKELELDRVKEQHEREKRDIDHKIGLHRQRVEQEIELSRKEAVLDVREENLKKDRERFEQEMDYTRKRFSEEVERLTTLQKEILEPEVERRPQGHRVDLRRRRQRQQWPRRRGRRLMPINYPQGWQNWSSASNNLTIYATGTGVSGVPYYPAYTQLPSVMDSPAELTDREWLDGQVDEVCELAAA